MKTIILFCLVALFSTQNLFAQSCVVRGEERYGSNGIYRAYISKTCTYRVKVNYRILTPGKTTINSTYIIPADSYGEYVYRSNYRFKVQIVNYTILDSEEDSDDYYSSSSRSSSDAAVLAAGAVMGAAILAGSNGMFARAAYDTFGYGTDFGFHSSKLSHLDFEFGASWRENAFWGMNISLLGKIIDNDRGALFSPYFGITGVCYFADSPKIDITEYGFSAVAGTTFGWYVFKFDFRGGYDFVTKNYVLQAGIILSW